MANARAHVLVAGLVQGVFFRNATQRLAVQHDVSGWVRNLPDGRVEVVLEGEESDVRAIVEWCHHGPPRAEVEDVTVDWESYVGDCSHFAIR